MQNFYNLRRVIIGCLFLCMFNRVFAGQYEVFSLFDSGREPGYELSMSALQICSVAIIAAARDSTGKVYAGLGQGMSQTILDEMLSKVSPLNRQNLEMASVICFFNHPATIVSEEDAIVPLLDNVSLIQNRLGEWANQSLRYNSHMCSYDLYPGKGRSPLYIEVVMSSEGRVSWANGIFGEQTIIGTNNS